MKYIILGMLLSIISHATTHEAFQKELNKVYDKDIYLIKVHEFEFKANPSTKAEKQIAKDMQYLLPMYLKLENPLDNRKLRKDFTSSVSFNQYTFVKLLARYMLFLNKQKKYDELKVLSRKTLENISKNMKSSRIVVDYLATIMYYKAMLQTLSCHDLEMQNILKENYPLDAEIFFKKLKQDEEYTLKFTKTSLLGENENIVPKSEKNTLVEQIMKIVTANSHKNLDAFIAVVKENSPEKIKEFMEENEREREKNIEKYTSISTQISFFASIAKVYITSTLSIQSDDFGSIPEHLAYVSTPRYGIFLDEVYSDHKKMIENYDALISSCTEVKN
jgi:hypothetical protein